MSTVVFTINATNADKEDRRTMKRIVQQANAAIAQENVNISQQNLTRAADQQLPLKTLWPISTGAEVVSSFEKVWIANRTVPMYKNELQQTLDQVRQQQMSQEFIDAFADATNAGITAALNALKTTP